MLLIKLGAVEIFFLNDSELPLTSDQNAYDH